MADYVIKKGDTLWDIANANGTTVADLAKINGISNPDLIQPGQVIKFSSSAGTSGTSPNTTTSNSPLTYTHWGDTEEGKAVNGAYDDAMSVVKNYGTHNWANKGIHDGLLAEYLNRPDFSYDLDGDALYQQYKDKYIKQGQLAMQDTMGQAAAMTGGYGNSYAQSVGQQAYNAQLDKLNDIVPELYQMAYDRYNQEGADMLNKLGVLDADYKRSFGEWETGYNMAKDRLDIASDNRINSATIYNNDVDNDFAVWEELQEADRWAKDFGLKEDTLELEKKIAGFDEAPANSIESLNASNNSGKKTTANTHFGYNNGSVSSSNIKAMQSALGVTADGKWGINSQKAAKAKWGTTDPAEAYSKYSESGSGKPESASNYADFDAGDWNGYFATIRQNKGVDAAVAELERMNKLGYIPKNMVSYASVGARGKLGH